MALIQEHLGGAEWHQQLADMCHIELFLFMTMDQVWSRLKNVSRHNLHGDYRILFPLRKMHQALSIPVNLTMYLPSDMG